MPQLSLTTLIHMPVKTKSGEVLGKVSEVLIDDANFHLDAILVTPKGIVRQLTSNDLKISFEQIIEINDKNVIVEDAISRGGGSRIVVEDLRPL